ncbi:kelch repeat-containing protein [Podospora australis]|uniref:Kelch repeat-containing protein n=1 Tax=Podospora australis TaxID=1536484 RepID=A0AAN6WQN0_9PEZI|nr:kelch repeat-containing protein [Podospora australis]
MHVPRDFAPLFLAVTWIWGKWTRAQEVVYVDPAVGTVPLTSDFLRRAFASAVVIGNYVYIDGGEVAERENGQIPGRASPSNVTISIPLNVSWNTSSVYQNFAVSPKQDTGAPVFDSQTVWRDPEGRGFYIWGGRTPQDTQPAPSRMWKFTIDGPGCGSWAQRDLSGKSALALGRAIRTTSGAWTQSDEVGYWVGGYAAYYTDTSIVRGSYLALPGVMAFDMKTGELTNSSTAGLGEYGTSIYGAAKFVPSFGSKGHGVVVMLGGVTSTVLNDGLDWKVVNFANVTVHDPVAKTWHSQITTGDRPPPLERACVVGVAGTGGGSPGTYEIFIYGGYNRQTDSASGEVYILSLPGFVFFKAPTDSTPTAPPRVDHACVLVGRSQMLSIGGTDILPSGHNGMLDPDPCYDADAKDYESPEVIKRWYDRGGLESVVWSSAVVKGMFLGNDSEGFKSNPTTSSGIVTSDQSTATPPENSDSQTESSGTPPIGAVVGGAAGGVVIVVLVGCAAWWILRTKRTKGKATTQEGLEYSDGSQERFHISSSNDRAPVPKLGHDDDGDDVVDSRFE